MIQGRPVRVSGSRGRHGGRRGSVCGLRRRLHGRLRRLRIRERLRSGRRSGWRLHGRGGVGRGGCRGRRLWTGNPISVRRGRPRPSGLAQPRIRRGDRTSWRAFCQNPTEKYNEKTREEKTRDEITATSLRREEESAFSGQAVQHGARGAAGAGVTEQNDGPDAAADDHQQTQEESFHVLVEMSVMVKAEILDCR